MLSNPDYNFHYNNSPTLLQIYEAIDNGATFDAYSPGDVLIMPNGKPIVDCGIYIGPWTE